MSFMCYCFDVENILMHMENFQNSILIDLIVYPGDKKVIAKILFTVQTFFFF